MGWKFSVILGILCFIVSTICQPIKYFGFQEDGVKNAESVMVLEGVTLPDMESLAICFRFKYINGHSFSTILSYAVKGYDNELSLRIHSNPTWLKVHCCYNKLIASAPIEVIPYQWHSVCLSLTLKNLSLNITFDGEVTPVSISNVEPIEHVTGGGKLLFGQDQDSVGTGFEAFESYSGYLSSFVMVNSTLDIEDMVTWSSSIDDVQDALISFEKNSQDFSLNKVGEYNSSDESIFFKSIYPLYHAFSTDSNYEGSQLLCNSLGGNIAAPENEEENQKLFDLISNLNVMCNVPTLAETNTWLGYRMVDGKITHHKTGVVGNSTFIHNEGVAIKNEMCFTFFGCLSDSIYWHKKWVVKRCNSKKKTVCNFNNYSLLKLRGLCSDTTLDKNYYLTDSLLNPTLRGVTQSEIQYVEDDDGHLAWSIIENGNKIAHLEDNELGTCNCPFGKHKWTFNTNECNLQGRKHELMITTCSDNKFTCGDGSCIDIIKRCNYEIDCEDESDESYCDILIMPGSNQTRRLSPPKLKSSSYSEVFIHVNITRVVNLDLNAFKAIFYVKITMSWYDARVKFANLRSSIVRNEINLERPDKPWIPSYNIYGDGFTSSDMDNPSRVLRIDRKANSIDDDITHLTEDTIYLGSENPFRYKTIQILNTSCDFHFGQFPFDLQTCMIYIRLRNIGIKLSSDPVLGAAEYGKTCLSLQYGVREFSHKMINATIVNNETVEQMLAIKFVFENQHMFYLSNTYLPSLFLLVIGYMTFYFSVRDFNERIMVALTSLLVETTLFTQITNYVPGTSYFKMIDYWCIFCMSLLFTIILAQTIINVSLTYSSTRRRINSVNCTCKNTTTLNNSVDKRLNTKNIEVKPIPKYEEKTVDETLRKLNELIGRGLDSPRSADNEICARNINGIMKVIFPCILICFIFVYLVVLIVL